jgi:predicted permease
MTWWMMRLASRMPILSVMPWTLHLEPDLRVLLFALGLTVFAGLALGLVPALRATRADLTSDLKEGGSRRLGKGRRFRLRHLLVVTKVAGSLALLLITGFLVIGHRRIVGAEIGFDPQRLQVISLDPIRDGYSAERASALFKYLLERVERLPGVTSASVADAVPMSMVGKPGAQFSVAGPGGAKVIRYARRPSVGEGFFETFGIAILRGRSFRKEDMTDRSRAAIVSENLARELWKDADPLGQRLEIGSDEVSGVEAFEVVGVARKVRDGVSVDAPGVIYLPLRPRDYGRAGPRGVTLAVRAAPGVDALGAVRREIAALDEKLTPFDARSMPEQIDQLMFPVQVVLWTYGFIGVFGLILASVGLAGVTAHSVARRRREIGIRVALGARKADVLGLVMKEGAALVALGTAIGLALAWAGMRSLAAIMSSIARTAGAGMASRAVVVGAPLLLAAVALVACYLPARESLRVDPVVALRQE